MPAYIFVEVDIKDPVRYEDYKKLTPATLEKYGGKFIVRGGKTELMEGTEEPERIVILEFENSEKAKTWWNSPEYSEAKKIRYATAESRMILLEGI
ncbi:MAG: DUF1330 domain-containing protein [Ignavibacteriales bacterium]|nr:MAG: DUF1330 domain-containing protein [Ignavibacteriales bacterium]